MILKTKTSSRKTKYEALLEKKKYSENHSIFYPPKTQAVKHVKRKMQAKM